MKELQLAKRKETVPERKLPIGSEVRADGTTDFRVWAPKHRVVRLVIEDMPNSASYQQVIDMTAESEGYFSATAVAPAGTLYRFELDDGKLYPDPASRFQPFRPEGPSQVVDPTSFAWTDNHWPGITLKGQVLYEMHIGTFTQEGTWQAAARQLAELAELGITLLEIMPVGDWPGEFGWGYDGVCLFAPRRQYGPPDDFRAFVNQAHAHGIGVLLDIVYNHAGTVGHCFDKFSKDYFRQDNSGEWGPVFNFDGPRSAAVREFFVANAHYWIEEFHLDGYRVDATQAFVDESSEHILAAITREARAAAGTRSIVLIAESEPQDTLNVRPIEQGGFGMDGLWNDDFHHSAMVRLTGHNEAYYTDYLGIADEFIALIKWGYLYQGQRYKWQKKRRGTPGFDLPPAMFVNYLQNHDQIANTGMGTRIHKLTSPGCLRAITALWLLMPETPLLFQGQEFAASTPFCYFLDSAPKQAKQVATGRAKFLSQFPSLAQPEMQQRFPNPADPLSFQKCKLRFEERELHGGTYALHKDLLALRREDPAIAGSDRTNLDAGALGRDAFVVRFFYGNNEDRLLVINLGADLHFDPAPQPLLAPLTECLWAIAWSSEDPRYGGTGTPPLDTEENWRVPGESTILLKAVRNQ